MALARQNFTLKFGQGLDTKTDPKQVDIGKLTELENGTFQSTNRLTKRQGSSELASSTKPATGNAIASFKDELLVMDGKSLYSYGEQFDNLLAKGTKTAISVTSESIIKNSYQQTSPDSCLLNGLSAYAWEDSQGGVHYSVFDNATQQLIINNQTIAGASTCKLVAVGNFFAIIYVEASSTSYLKALVIDSANPSGSPVTVTLATISNTNQYYDASSTGSFIYVAYTDASGNLACIRSDDSFTPSTPLTLAVTANQKAMVLGALGSLRVGYSTGTDIRFVTVDAGLTAFGSPVVIEAVAGVVNLTALETSLTNFKWYYEIDATNAYDHYVRACTVSNLTPGTPADFNRSVGIWSKPFAYGGDHYIVLVHESELQDTYFVFNSSGSVVSKIAPANGGGLSPNGTLREVNVQAGGKFEFAYLIKDLVESIGGDVYTQTGVNSAVLTFGNQIFTESLGSNLNTSGGIVSAYDGQNVVEQNFFLYPENISAESVIFGGNLGKGSYQYCATYEWTDAQGQIHISAPSVPTAVDFTDLRAYIEATNGTFSGSSFFLTTKPKNAFIGLQVSGPGVGLSTYLTEAAFFAGAPNTANISVSTPFTATTSPNTLTSNLTFTVPIQTTLNSDVATFTQTSVQNVIGDLTTGSSVIKVYNPDQVKPGMYFNYSGEFMPINVLITSKTGDLVTVSSSSPTTEIGQNLWLSTQYSFTTVVGSNTFTIALGPYDCHLSIGQKFTLDTFISGTRFAAGTTITNVSVVGTTATVTMSATAIRAGTAFAFFGMTPQVWIKPNQTFTAGAGFLTDVRVESVNKFTITLDKTASASGASTLVTDKIYSVNLTIPTLRVTEKKTDETPVSIAVYRTLKDETLFYRSTPFDTPLLNDVSVDSVAYQDTQGDVDLVGNEQLYTTGGVLANGAPPAADILAQYRNRLVAVSSEDPYTWHFSKPVGTNTPVQFSPFFYKKIPEQGGPITALGVMDDKLIFFKRSSIFIVVGAGPNNLGLQDDFNDAELVTTDTGCAEPKSVVRMPLGLMYKSSKGIYLLDRGLNVKYVGDDVEAYNSDTVTSSELIETLNQVRFTLSSGKTLVYDYYFDQWSVFTNQNAVDSTIFNGRFTYIRPDGKIYRETPGVWTDGGLPIYLKAKTAWLSFNGLQGLERLYNAMILGEYKSPHSMTFKVAHDFGADSQTTVIPVATNPGLYQYKVYLSRQKSEAVQFTLQESQAGPTYGEGLSISAVSLEVGVKKGLNTLPAGKLYG